MHFEITSHLNPTQKAAWSDLLAQADLRVERCAERTLLLYEDGVLVATGARDGGVLKYLAVAPDRQGEDLTARVATELRKDAFASGHTHLFVYTKPCHGALFSSLLFYPVAECKDVLVLESKRDGLKLFLDGLPPAPTCERVGAIVAHCNPFTLGHRYLIEQAVAECEKVFVFVLSEETAPFPPQERIEMVRRGTADLPSVTVLPTGPYLVSQATFPTYFLEDGGATAYCDVDLEIFAKHVAPRLAVTHRFVGTEPHSCVTASYNAALRTRLPKEGIAVRELERLSVCGCPISASTVRELLAARKTEELSHYLPETTIAFLRERNYL